MNISIENWYVADFETTTDVVDNERTGRVWLWCLTNVADTTKTFSGTDIKSFYQKLMNLGNKSVRIFFHNLGFDGQFIIPYLEELGYDYTEEKKITGKKYNLIVANSQWYSITFPNRKGKLIRINDSLKLIPFKVSVIAEKFGLPYKESIEYDYSRPIGYKPTEDEVHYCYRDTEIVCLALRELANKGIDKLTTASSAISMFKKFCDGKWDDLFPALSKQDDDFIRRAYRGGFCYVEPEYVNKLVEDGMVLDVNSLYPSRMYYCPMPKGKPIYFRGKWEKGLYVQHISCRYKLKDGYIPCLMSKGFLCKKIDYKCESNGIEELYLTNIDLKLFIEHYDVDHITYIDGFAFQALMPDAEFNPFMDYIDYYIKMKIEATKNKNKVDRQVSKLMLNSLYGKFASRLEGEHSIPYIDDLGCLRFQSSGLEDMKAYYLPVAVFTTAYGRDLTIRTAQKIKEQGKFIYSDTDSIHILASADISGIEIDDTALGKWAIEERFDKGKYLRQKTYLHQTDGKYDVKCCGMPSSCYEQINFDTFHGGAVFAGKLQRKKIKGGCELVDTSFKIML